MGREGVKTKGDKRQKTAGTSGVTTVASCVTPLGAECGVGNGEWVGESGMGNEECGVRNGEWGVRNGESRNGESGMGSAEWNDGLGSLGKWRLGGKSICILVV